jgi:hypothetical protein
MKSATRIFARLACDTRREDELLLTLVVFVVCFVLLAR